MPQYSIVKLSRGVIIIYAVKYGTVELRDSNKDRVEHRQYQTFPGETQVTLQSGTKNPSEGKCLRVFFFQKSVYDAEICL